MTPDAAATVDLPGRPMLGEIRDLYAYNRWANARILDAAARFTEDERRRAVGGSFGSLKDTLAHMLGAEWIWWMRWRGEPPDAVESWDDLDFPTFRARWADFERDQTAFLDQLDEAALHRVIAYRTLNGQSFEGPLWRIMRHVVNHATYHRGQVTLLIRLLGGEPAFTDMERYFREIAVPDAARSGR